jgi:hypothetical protein
MIHNHEQLFKTFAIIENYLADEPKLTESQMIYFTDTRAKYEAAVNLIGNATAQYNDFLDKRRFNPRSAMGNY